jgi:hypothetical protein
MCKFTDVYALEQKRNQMGMAAVAYLVVSASLFYVTILFACAMMLFSAVTQSEASRFRATMLAVGVSLVGSGLGYLSMRRSWFSLQKCVDAHRAIAQRICAED